MAHEAQAQFSGQAGSVELEHAQANLKEHTGVCRTDCPSDPWPIGEAEGCACVAGVFGLGIGFKRSARPHGEQAR
jgi:hypothetical protein